MIVTYPYSLGCVVTEFSEVGARDVPLWRPGSGSSQLVEEGPRSPKALGEHRRILPYPYTQMVLEPEGRPRREHHAVFFGEPVGELEGGHVELVAQEGQQPAPRRRPREEVGALLDEAVGRLQVLADDLPVTLDDAISVFERQNRQRVGELARAQGGVTACSNTRSLSPPVLSSTR